MGVQEKIANVGVQENIASAQAGYAAFKSGDHDGVRAVLDDDVEWVVRGDNSLAGVKRGKQDTMAYFEQIGEKGLDPSPQRFIGDGTTVVVMVDLSAGGEQWSAVDVIEFNDDAKVVRFEAFGGEEATKRLFG